MPPSHPCPAAGTGAAGDGAADDAAGAVSALPPLEHALLWCLRAWAMGRCRGRDCSGRIAEVFSGLGAPAAAGCFEGFMWALNHGAVRVLDVRCACAAAVSADEAALLDAFVLAGAPADAGPGRPLAAAAPLEGMTTPAATRACLDSAARVLALLRAAGHAPSRTPAALARHACRAPAAWRGLAASVALH